MALALPGVSDSDICLDGGHQFTVVRDYYRAQYYEVLDLLIGEISRRFDQKSLAIPGAIEELLMKASNNLTIQ